MRFVARVRRRWAKAHVRVEAVGHELGLSVRGDEGDGAVALEARETHALMELDVLHDHRLPLVT